jgi:hypothetical protein
MAETKYSGASTAIGTQVNISDNIEKMGGRIAIIKLNNQLTKVFDML